MSMLVPEDGRRSVDIAAQRDPSENETQVEEEESITGEFYGGESADWRPPATYGTSDSSKQDAADAAQATESQSNISKGSEEDSAQAPESQSHISERSAGDSAEKSVSDSQEDSASITDEFYLGESETVQPADWQVRSYRDEETKDANSLSGADGELDQHIVGTRADSYGDMCDHSSAPVLEQEAYSIDRARGVDIDQNSGDIPSPGIGSDESKGSNEYGLYDNTNDKYRSDGASRKGSYSKGGDYDAASQESSEREGYSDYADYADRENGSVLSRDSQEEAELDSEGVLPENDDLIDSGSGSEREIPGTSQEWLSSPEIPTKEDVESNHGADGTYGEDRASFEESKCADEQGSCRSDLPENSSSNGKDRDDFYGDDYSAPTQLQDSLDTMDNTIMREETARLREEIEVELDVEEEEKIKDDGSALESDMSDGVTGRKLDAEKNSDQYRDGSISINSASSHEASTASVEPAIEELDSEDGSLSEGEDRSRVAELHEDLTEERSLDTLVESQSEWNTSLSTMGSNDRQELPKLSTHQETVPIAEEEEGEDEEDGGIMARTSTHSVHSVAPLGDLNLSSYETDDLFGLGEEFLKNGNVKKAHSCFDALVSASQQRYGKSHPKVAQELFDVASTFLKHGEAKDAVSYYEDIIHLKKSGAEESDRVGTLFRIGSAFLLNDDAHDSGYECMQEMLRMHKQPFADDLSTMGAFFHSKGSELSTIGCLEEALLCYELVADIWDKGEGRQTDIAVLRGEMAELYDELENEPEAIACYLECIEMKEKLGEDSTSELESLGMIYSKIGDIDKASDCLEECLKAKETVGDSTVDTLVKLCSIYADAERNGEAIVCVKKCIAAMKKEGDDTGLADMYDRLGSLHLAQESLEDAIAAFEEEVSRLIVTAGEEDDAVAAASYRLGSIYMEQGNHEKSLNHFERVAKIRTARLGEVHPQVADTYYIMASISLDQGDNEVSTTMPVHDCMIDLVHLPSLYLF